ncbi:MAG: DUF493 family protein [Rhodothermales bacterium]
MQPTSNAWWDKFRTLLDDQNEWPTTYLFKFIAPKDKAEQVEQLFEGVGEVTVRASSKGSWRSITTRVHVESADRVVDYYRQAAEIEGVISL